MNRVFLTTPALKMPTLLKVNVWLWRQHLLGVMQIPVVVFHVRYLLILVSLLKLSQSIAHCIILCVSCISHIPCPRLLLPIRQWSYYVLWHVPVKMVTTIWCVSLLSTVPSLSPNAVPSTLPSSLPLEVPTCFPSRRPSSVPSSMPSTIPFSSSY